MDGFKKIVIWLASLLCILSITGSIYALVLHETVFDRTDVKEWLRTSEVYNDNKVVATLIQPSVSTNASQPSLPPEAIKAAFGTTFTSDFIRTQTESVVDSVYNWIEGESTKIQFSVPIDQKRDKLIHELTQVIKPQVSKLPVCQIDLTTDCRPPMMTAEQLAQRIATSTIESSNLLNEPLTAASFAPPANQKASALPTIVSPNHLPRIYTIIEMLLIVLPIIVVLSILIIVLMARGSHRIILLKKLFRRTFLSVVLSVIVAVILLWLTQRNDFGLQEILSTQSGAIGELLVPFIKNIITGLLTSLLILSSIIALISLVLWLGLSFVGKKMKRSEIIARLQTND